MIARKKMPEGKSAKESQTPYNSRLPYTNNTIKILIVQLKINK